MNVGNSALFCLGERRDLLSTEKVKTALSKSMADEHCDGLLLAGNSSELTQYHKASSSQDGILPAKTGIPFKLYVFKSLQWFQKPNIHVE